MSRILLNFSYPAQPPTIIVCGIINLMNVRIQGFDIGKVELEIFKYYVVSFCHPFFEDSESMSKGRSLLKVS